MTKWWHVSWKRVVMALVIVFGAFFAAFAVFNGMMTQLSPWVTVQEITKDDPGAALTPVELPNRSLATLDGLPIAFHGLSFQTPWTQITDLREKKNFLLVRFANGADIMIFDPPITSQQAAFFRGDATVDRILGHETLQSNYAFMAAELAVTPAQVHWWNTARTNARSLFLLGRKSIILHDGRVIYKVNSGELRGFQIGDPSVAPYAVWLELFDQSDRQHEIWITARNSHAPVLSQAEINAMLASFKPVPQA